MADLGALKTLQTKTLVIVWLSVMAASFAVCWWVADSRADWWRDRYVRCMDSQIGQFDLYIQGQRAKVMGAEDWIVTSRNWRFDGQGDWSEDRLKPYSVRTYRPAWAHILLRQVGLRLLIHGTRHVGGSEWISWGSMEVP